MPTLDATVIAVIVIAAIVIVVAAVAFWYIERKRSLGLQERFGPEYERTVSTAGRRQGEKELREREERVQKLNIVPLSADAQRGYSESWRSVQAHFVDDPGAAIGEADDLVQRVMAERGYPIGDFDQRVADISVEHADVADNYRAAHAIALAHQRGTASTEQLRQAMVHYRSLFDELLSEAGTTSATARR